MAAARLAGKASTAATADALTVRETCRRIFLAMMVPDAVSVVLRFHFHRALFPFAGGAAEEIEMCIGQ
ncbi:hypothetical protein [Streptomyces sp. Tu 3180]|uniref:hypothetical protein n=1 Tax=Streptomyces sp. Tu 3180 TaxID=2682611 RepID=UPI001356E009|nr:hypothetical protein [Streptomyces sp. Tu 3180]KAF3468707.1 hypothetical protein GL259_33475 [Streptomyces sp. Tu 3180]